MIGRLRGELLEFENSSAIVDVCGVGYIVHMPETAAQNLPPLGENVELFIRQVFREDGASLYGFSDAFERKMFDLLIGVTGCGPKAALSLLGTLGASGTARAIATQDSRELSRAQGVGPKLAARLTNELQDRVGLEASLFKSMHAASKVGLRPSDELVDALVQLGYRKSEAELAASVARDQAESLEEQLRVAIRGLRK